MTELINKLHRILCEIKGFNAGYSSKTSCDGKMIIEYQGKRYAVFIDEMGDCEEESTFKAIDKLEHWF